MNTQSNLVNTPSSVATQNANSENVSRADFFNMEVVS